MVEVKRPMVCGIRLTLVSILALLHRSWVNSDKLMYVYQLQLFLLQKGIQILYCNSVVIIGRDSVPGVGVRGVVGSTFHRTWYTVNA